MESDIKISPEQFCRTCLCKSTNMRSLTSKMEGEHRTLLEALIFIVNLDIKTSEKVPTQLCNECEIVLLKADEFKRRCVESETILEAHMKNDNFVHFDVSVCNKPELKAEPPVRKVKTSKNVSKKRSTKSEKPNKPAIFDLFASSSCKSVKNEKEDAANMTPDCFDNKFSDLLDIKPDIEMPVKSETDNQNSDSGDSLDAPIDFGESDDFDTPLIALKQENSFLDELKMYSCISCGVVCNTEKEYKDHLQEKKCNANENGFTKSMKIKILKKHSNGSRNITIKRQILCPECGEEFKSVKACRLHRRTHKNDDNDKGVYKCNKCMRKFSRKSSYTTHMNHHDLKANVKYTCDTCKREFQHRAHLDNHILSVHTAQKGYTCEVCSTNFSTQESLDTHKESHKMEKKHICHLCNKSFYMLSTLNDHMRTHTGEKPFLCSICGKGFSQKTNLTQHMWRHQGLKPFKCEECERRFVSKGELVAHTRKHSGAHPFICDDCGSGFTTSSSLVKHRRTHTGERPYACDLCPMRFAASGTLKNHRRTHTGEKPFQCSYCEKAFVQRHDLISHIRCHTGERPYTCGCGLAFRKAASMRHHAKMHARDGMHCPQIPMLGAVPEDQPMKMGHH